MKLCGMNSFQSNAIRKDAPEEPSWGTQNWFYSDDVTVGPMGRIG
jgi:hypothetical protein